MTNAWIDDRFFQQPWVRLCGIYAATIYIASMTAIHRRATDSVRLTRREIEDELPWPIPDAEFEAAIQRLTAREKILIDGDEIAFPDYVAEQEPHERRNDRSTRGRNAATARWEAEKLKKSCPEHARSIPKMPDASFGHPEHASGPVRSESGPNPVRSIPDSASAEPQRGTATALAPPPPDPPPKPPKHPTDLATTTPKVPRETVEAKVERFMTTPPTDDEDRSWRFYFVRFVVAYGTAPTYPTRGKKRWRSLLAEVGVEEFCRRISIYFDGPPRTKFLNDGPRDFERLIEHFALLAADSGKTTTQENDNRVAAWRWEVRDRFAAANGNAPTIAKEFAEWIGITTNGDSADERQRRECLLGPAH